MDGAQGIYVYYTGVCVYSKYSEHQQSSVCERIYRERIETKSI